jgi:hypothetical protein
MTPAGEATRFACVTDLPLVRRTVVGLAEKGGRSRWKRTPGAIRPPVAVSADEPGQPTCRAPLPCGARHGSAPNSARARTRRHARTARSG